MLLSLRYKHFNVCGVNHTNLFLYNVCVDVCVYSSFPWYARFPPTKRVVYIFRLFIFWPVFTKCIDLKSLFFGMLIFIQNSNLLSRYLEVGWPWINDFKMPYFLILSTEHHGALVFICNTHVWKDLCTQHTDVCMCCLYAYSSVAVSNGLEKKTSE